MTTAQIIAVAAVISVSVTILACLFFSAVKRLNGDDR